MHPHTPPRSTLRAQRRLVKNVSDAKTPAKTTRAPAQATAKASAKAAGGDGTPSSPKTRQREEMATQLEPAALRLPLASQTLRRRAEAAVRLPSPTSEVGSDEMSISPVRR